MLRPYRLIRSGERGIPRYARNDGVRVRGEWQIDDNWGAGEELLDFAQLFVARILAGNDHFVEAENIFDVAEICGFGQRALQNGIVDAEELLQHSALLRLQARKRFVG